MYGESSTTSSYAFVLFNKYKLVTMAKNVTN